MPLDNLIDYLSGHADPRTADTVRAHLDAGCPTCVPETVWIVRALSALREQQTPSVPEQALRAASARFRERYTRQEQPTQERTTIFARLRFDSRNQPTFALARGSRGRTVQAIYEAHDHDFELWQEEQENGSWYLIGQILPGKDPAAVRPPSVTLIGSDNSDLWAFTAPDSTTNEFHLDNIQTGVYDITVRLADVDVRLKDVVIGE